MRKSHRDRLALAARLLKDFRIGQRADARTRSRTSSLRSRVILRTTAVVHFGFDAHCEQSLLLQRGRACFLQARGPRGRHTEQARPNGGNRSGCGAGIREDRRTTINMVLTEPARL